MRTLLALVLSGGISPASNHASQYLQTRTLTEGLRQRLGDEAVEVRFGAGNSTANPKRLPDVHAVEHGIDQIIYGVIPGNEPATKANVVARLTSLPLGSDPFFLFVSDHGSPGCINLWSFDPAASVVVPDGVCLAKDELKSLLPKSKTVVFAMTQCYSGGFHQMSVDTSGTWPEADPRICGFTAVTEDTTASGCTPDVDGPNYQGYERYLTEQVTGHDVVTGAALQHGARATVHDAHVAAALEDKTKDIPLSTSDFFLRAWAAAIEAPGFKPRPGTTSGVDAPRQLAELLSGPLTGQTFDVGIPWLDTYVRDRQEFLSRTQTLLANEHPDLVSLIQTGTDAELATNVAAVEHELTTWQGHAEQVDASWNRLRYDRILPKWTAAVAAHTIPGLTQAQTDWELQIVGPLEKQYHGEPGAASHVASDLLLRLSAMTAASPDEAAAFEAYLAARDEKIGTWIDGQDDADLKAAWSELESLGYDRSALFTKVNDLQRRRDHLRRIRIYRRVVAAAVVLGKLGDATALTELQGLLACESTAF